MGKNVSREQQMQEAARRLKIIKLFDETARQFLEDGQLSYSETALAACYWIDDEMAAAVAKFEKKYGAIVYHIIRNNTEFGILDSYFYVSRHPDEWPLDRDDLKSGYALVFVHAVNAEEGYSEFGTIQWKRGAAGGLLRLQ